ncbi:hypothetical protein [Streptomyces sp. 35G-GA-8]|uniref:hypothetical protein n=1 Tax=Streptomyces sp. 35G-GA-8 TaxID=2939434 RepID=UPI00201EC58F|nr:hypothetical protein [Streptomyces sp. 35G-GA-8]MCL7380389.1 hypothetical protein [Streptomyces sp. 35G-GA-8]
MRSANRILATTAPVWSDDVCAVDSTPVECGRSRERVKPSDPADVAEYGYCDSEENPPGPGEDVPVAAGQVEIVGSLRRVHHDEVVVRRHYRNLLPNACTNRQQPCAH